MWEYFRRNTGSKGIGAVCRSRGAPYDASDDATRPFGEDMTRETVTEMWRQSGLSGPEFRQQHYPDATITVEVGKHQS